MDKNKKVKLITALALLVTMTGFMTGCKNKATDKNMDTAEQTEQGSSNTVDKQQGDKEGSAKPEEVSIDDWKFDVPEGYVLEENEGPWYEKSYANEKGVVLIFGYYAPNGMDNRTEKELFEDQRSLEKQDLISRYGSGEITYEKADKDNLYLTAYYETRDLKVLKRSKLEGQVWKTLYIQLPITENEKDYEYILDTVK